MSIEYIINFMNTPIIKKYNKEQLIKMLPYVKDIFVTVDDFVNSAFNF